MTFKPAWWLPGAHLQTVWATLIKRRTQVSLRRERIEFADGDFVDLDWTTGQGGPLVLVLHGLEGSVNSPYAQGILQTLHQQNWRGVLMHFRSCSGEMNRLANSYHSGDTRDLESIVTLLKDREPNTPLAIIGYSVGGNVLLKWLGEASSRKPIVAAVAISVPFLLAETVKRLEKGFSKIYQQHLLKSLRNKMLLKMQQYSFDVSLDKVKTLTSLREFDELVTAQLNGFKNANDYYQRASSRQFLKNITTPTLLIHAKDDPFMTEEALPSQEELSPFITFDLQDKGGHVGFVMGKNPWNASYWLEERIPHFLKNYIG